MPITIVSQSSQAAPAGKAGTSVTGTGETNPFGSLLATLMAMTSTPAGSPQGQAGTNGTASFDAALLALQGNAPASATTEGLSETDLAKLFKLLDQAGIELEANGALAPQTMDQLATAIDALMQLTNTPSPASGGAEVNTSLLAAQSGAGASQPGATPMDALLAKLNALTTHLADAGTPATPVAQTATNSADLPDLAYLSGKLQNLAQQLLAAQADPKTQQTTTPAATQTAAKNVDPELANAVNMLFGNKQTGDKAADPAKPGTNAALQIAQAGLDDGDTGLSMPKIEATPTGAKGDADKPAATPQRADTTTAAMAALNANAAANPSQAQNTAADPLLVAQSTNQLGTTQVDAAAALKPMTAAYQTPAPNLNMPHIAFEMVRQMRDGSSRFQIRLDPPEMGKIDVKMHMDGAGNVHARLTVERADTLDLLQRDSRALERALQQAGLESGRTNLEFSLKQNPFAGQNGQQNYPGASDRDLVFGQDTASDDATLADIPSTLIYRGTASPGGINMFA